MVYHDTDPRRMIARLSVAVLVADGRVTNDEIDALEWLDTLGMGPISYQAADEIHRAKHHPIDLAGACAPLLGASPQGIATIMATLIELAASDGEISKAERATLAAIAGHFGFPPSQLQRLVESAPTGPGAHVPLPGTPLRVVHLDSATREPARPAAPQVAEDAPPLPGDGARPASGEALRVLGLQPGADRSEIDAAYLDLVERFSPAHVIGLGPEFVVLAIRKLNYLTKAYEAAVSPGRSETAQ